MQARASLRGRRAAIEHGAQGLGVDVAAAEDQPDALAVHALALLEQGRERRGARALGYVVGGGPVDADRLGYLVLADANQARRTFADDIERLRVGLAAGHPVGKRARRT